MLSFLLRCFHFSYYVAALSPMLLLLLQYCCSSFNIAAPSSMLPLHLDVASPPSILTLQRVSEMRMVICRKEQPNWWPPPLMLPLFLWWIDVSANSQYYCSSIVVAAFPWMLKCPCKNELFSIAGPSNWSLHNRLAIPWSLWSLHPFFDVSTPPLMLPVLHNVTTPPLMLLLPPSCCCSCFYVAPPPSMLPLHLDAAIPPLILPFFLWCSCYSSMLLLPIEVASPPSMSLKIWVQDPVSGIKDQGSGVQDPEWPINELHFAYLVTPHNVVVPLWKYSTFKWHQKRN